MDLRVSASHSSTVLVCLPSIIQLLLDLQGDTQFISHMGVRHLLHLAAVEGVEWELVLVSVEERQVQLVAVGQDHLQASCDC